MTTSGQATAPAAARATDRRLEVLVVTNMYPSADAPAKGVFVHEYVRSVVARGVGVDVFAIDGGRARSEYVRAVPALARRLRRTQFDLVHAQHTYCAVLVAVAGALARRRPPMLLTMHEGESFLPTGLRDPDADRVKRLVYSKRLKRTAARLADQLVTVAPGLSDALTLRIPHEVIPPGVDVDRFRPLDRAACREQLGLSPEAPIVFFPGSAKRGFNKGVALFTEAVNALGAPVQVVRGGGIHPQDMPLHINAADVVVQASLFEASPMVVKETMACERPIVSTDVGDVRELFAGVPGCFLARQDARDLAEKMAQAIELDGNAAGGRARILERGLTLDAVAERYVALYERMALEPARRRT